MADGKWISYLRVSTDRQGKSGLGIEAQRTAVADYLNGGNWSLVKEFVEVESGKRTDRPMLAEAIKACRVYGAKLVIAKLDRLSRDAHFLLGLEKAGVDFVCADLPNANRLTVGIMAMVVEEERRMISKRTKDACSGNKIVTKVPCRFEIASVSRHSAPARSKAAPARILHLQGPMYGAIHHSHDLS
jgi:DNA invertase Pin-like site-specific DNA recombinase